MQKPDNLLSRFDRDPGRWRPLFYSKDLSVPVTAGQRASVSIQLSNQPFILKRVRLAIIGDCDRVVTGLVQDGQLFFDWKDEQSVYVNGPLLAAAFCGWPGSGDDFGRDLPYPIPYAGNRTLLFNVWTTYTRVLVSEAETFDVQIQLHGVSDWGTLEDGHTNVI